jgi:hypothetical protein
MSKKRFVLFDMGPMPLLHPWSQSRRASYARYNLFSARCEGSRDVEDFGDRYCGHIEFSEDPYHPDGFGHQSLYAEKILNIHRNERFRAYGKPIRFSSLPPQAQRFAKAFIDAELSYFCESDEADAWASIGVVAAG